MFCRVALGTQIVEQRVNSEVQIKVLLKPMNNPLGVSPSKGKQGTTRGKEKNLLTSVGIEPTGRRPPEISRAKTRQLRRLKL